jgi:hypothetical protein
MKSARIVTIIVVGLSILPVRARALDQTTTLFSGNRLYEACTSTNAIDGAACVAYVAGVTDTLWQVQSELHAALLCNMTHQITTQQLADIVAKYLGAHPELRHFAASGLVGIALTEAFPCK